MKYTFFSSQRRKKAKHFHILLSDIITCKGQELIFLTNEQPPEFVWCCKDHGIFGNILWYYTSTKITKHYLALGEIYILYCLVLHCANTSHIWKFTKIQKHFSGQSHPRKLRTQRHSTTATANCIIVGRTVWCIEWYIDADRVLPGDV